MTNSNVLTVQAIGKGTRLSESAVPAILASVPEAYDWAAKSAVPNAVHAWACGASPRPKQKTGPVGAQVTTDYGRGVDTLVSAVKKAVKGETVKPASRLALNLSGTEVSGGTLVIAPDHPLYDSLMALFVEEQATEAEAA